MQRRAWVGAAAVALTLTGCGDADPSPPTPADLQDIDLSVDHTVVVDDDGYDPSSLEVIAGEVIRLVNEGESEHSFTADDRSIDTGRMEPGEDVTLVLTEPGKITFFDLENPDQRGTITVQPLG
jgi:plastocyanin